MPINTKANKNKVVHVAKLRLLNKKVIERYVNEQYKNFGKQLIILDKTASTHTYLAELFKIQRPHRFLGCLAECQTAGKGRLGRSWFSPYASNIYLSVYWRFVQEVSVLTGLSIALAVATVRALKVYGIRKDITLKWPNDVYWRGKKLAGILVDFYGKRDVVLSVGLNVNMPRANNIDQAWCDVAQIIGRKPARNKLVGLLLNALVTALEEFQRHGLKPFLKEWQRLDIAYGEKIAILTPQHKKIEGIGCGINDKGYFLLKGDDNKVQQFVVGDISLRVLEPR